MGIIFPPEARPEDIVFVIENDENNIILYYKNRMFTEHFMMNFMIVADQIFDITNIRKFESHIKPIIDSIEEKMGHKCTGLNFWAYPGSRKYYKNKKMLCHVNTFDDYIHNYKKIIENLSLEFTNKTLFEKIKENDYEIFHQSSIEVMIKEFNRLKKNVPLFDRKKLYIITSIVTNNHKKSREREMNFFNGFGSAVTDYKESRQILKIKFTPDQKTNILLIPTLHDSDGQKQYSYRLKFLGSFKNFYQFEDKHDVFNLEDNVIIKKTTEGIDGVKKCSKCNTDSVFVCIENDNNNYNVCMRINSTKNQNFLTFIKKI